MSKTSLKVLKLIFLSKVTQGYSKFITIHFYTEKRMKPSTLKSCKMLKQKMASLTWVHCIVQLMDVKVKLPCAFVLHVETNSVWTIKR